MPVSKTPCFTQKGSLTFERKATNDVWDSGSKAKARRFISRLLGPLKRKGSVGIQDSRAKRWRCQCECREFPIHTPDRSASPAQFRAQRVCAVRLT
ncbi:hypothetical protein Bbelb_210010 [Branchiostoma belcheri]|nr:hypothetical protein Bbelb_210010 [Branchiostoma belcheri]